MSILSGVWSNTGSSTGSPHSFGHGGVVMSSGEFDFEVVPGKGVGEFLLGASINDVIACISLQYSKYTKVKLIFNNKDPFDQDIILDISDLCIQLRFDPIVQCLKAVEVYSFEHVRLVYGKSRFGGAEEVDYTYAHVENVFGVTRAEYVHAKKSYLLDYPGLRLAFEVPEHIQKNYVRHKNDLAQERAFCDGSPALLSSLCVCSGKVNNPTVSQPLVAANAGLFFHENIHVHIGKGITFTKRNIKLSFGDSTQDVLTALGRPRDVFYKSENKMKIFRGSEGSSLSPPHTDYFFNYPSIGIDILFDGRSQRLRKFVLHNNLPNHTEFGEYARCNFQLVVNQQQQQQQQQQELEDDGATIVSEQPRNSSPQADAFSQISLRSDSSKRQQSAQRQQDPFFIRPSTIWRDVRRVLAGLCAEKKVVFNKPLEDGAVNPFGPTSLWGTQGAIFEVASTGHIATLTLFCTE